MALVLELSGECVSVRMYPLSYDMRTRVGFLLSTLSITYVPSTTDVLTIDPPLRPILTQAKTGTI